MTPISPPEPRRCRECGCVLSAYNDNDICSPCRSSEIVAMYRGPLSIRTPEQLAEKGFDTYREALGVSTPEALDLAFTNGLLPRSMRGSAPMMARLVDECEGLNHLEAATHLDMSRFTVAAWRKRLGMSPGRSRAGDEPSTNA